MTHADLASLSKKIQGVHFFMGKSLFFTQSPSFLAFQTAMRKNKGRDNADSLFGVKKIPCDNHIRDILDEVPPSAVFPFFGHIVSNLKTAGLLDPMRSYGNNVLCSLDGTTYFSSRKIHCENCSVTNHKNGTKTYSHAAVTPVFVKPGCNRVISLVPEFIVPQDGHEEQDCENAAAKRWLKQYGPFLKGLGSTVPGDDLYRKQPVCQAIKDQVKAIVADGRARWKIENENNNVLINDGYKPARNFGHGKKFLSMTPATLNILAFLLHTVLDSTDKKYRALRRSLPSGETFFDDVRALARTFTSRAGKNRSIL